MESEADSRQILSPITFASFSYRSIGLPVSQEALFLSRFAFDNIRNPKLALDMGCGCGLLAIILSLALPTVRFHAIDIQEQLIEMARTNCKCNAVENRIICSVADIRQVHAIHPPNTFDMIIANPPFRKTQTGRISPDTSKSIACHEISITMNDCVYEASIVLRSGGVFATVVLPERLLELFEIMNYRRLTPIKAQFIHHRRSDRANAVMILGRKNGRGTLEILPPIFVQNGSIDSKPKIES